MSAQIERVECYRLKIPLRRPISDAIYDRTNWCIPVVEITTADGLIGTGISGLWTGDDLVVDTIGRYFRPFLMGKNAVNIGRLWDEMYWAPIHWVGRAGVVHMAQSMIDIALWDLAAQRAGLPLWQMLGGRHSTLETYNTDGGWLNFTIDELIADITEIVGHGWKRVKVKVGGRNLQTDLERVRRVRDSLSSEILLMVDANQKWDLITARRALPRLVELSVDWLEEPLHPDDIGGHQALASIGLIPIALGENLYSAEQFATFLNAKALDIVQVDVTRVAGITEWLRVSAHAQERGRWVVPHAGDMMQVHQHLVAATSNAREPLIEYLPWGLEVFSEPAHISGGILTLPTTPGASTSVSPEAKSRFQDAPAN